MLVEQLHGNLADLGEAHGFHIERVRLGAHDRDRAVQRVVTDHGLTLGLRLPRGTVLTEGDILHRDSDRIIVVASEATPVIVIHPRGAGEMGRTAHALGNRHLPAQFAADADGRVEMIVPDDHTVAAYLDHYGVPFERTERVLTTPLRHAEHIH